MANTLGAYSPIFYAQEFLIHLRKNLGMASRVHRGFEAERNSFGMGETITIRKPSTFVALDAPSSSQNLDTQVVNIVLNQWKEVKFELTDKERAFTNERIIAEHIDPASYATADTIDQSLVALSRDIPWVSDYGSATDHTVITAARKVMFDNQVPMDGMWHYMIDSTLEAGFLNASTVLVGTAPTATEGALLRGSLGMRYGVEIFANQNVLSYTPGTASQAAGDKAGAVNVAAGLAKGATSVVVSGFTGSETIKAGDSFSIAGNTQKYAVTADVTLSGGAGTLSFTPPTVQAYANSSVITLTTAANDAAHNVSLMFHRNAFALAMAQLPMDLPGAEAFTASDPVTGLSVRARRFYDGNNSKLFMALDVLYGVKTLDPNLAVRSET
jgi:hypothetical protein